MTIEKWIQSTTQQLSSLPHSSARLDAMLLFEYVMRRDRSWILAHPADVIPIDSLSKLNQLLGQRKSGQPIAYILGRKEFYGYDFEVNPDVLIPRPETEAMIEILTEERKALGLKSDPVILDIGTGSGCLAITAKMLLPKSTVYATDISQPALTTASNNAQKHGVDITLLLGDLLDPILANKQAIPGLDDTIIVLANLPYVPNDLDLDEITLQEPNLALFGGQDGLDYYRSLLSQIAELPPVRQLILTEALIDQHQTMSEIFDAHGFTPTKTSGLVQAFYKG